MRHIRFLCIFLVLIGNKPIIKAQGFAGPDTCVLVRLGSSITLTLGIGSDNPDYCYTWTAHPGLISDPNQPTITVSLTPDPSGSNEYNYHVMRVSLCNGVEEDDVKVTLKTFVELVSVSPKYGCYNEGDYIFNEQFNIITNPPGYGYLANVHPTVAEINYDDGGNHQTVWFSITDNGVTTYASCQIYVLDPMVEVQSGPTVDFLGIPTLLSFINGKCVDIINSIGGPCELSPSISGTNPTYRFRQQCCLDHTPNTVCEITLGSLSVGVGTTCRFPFAGFPYIASADVVFRLSGEVAINPSTGVFSFNENCGTDFCTSGSVTISAEGGVGASLIGGKVAFIDGTIGGSGSVSFTKCVKSRNNQPPILKLKIYAAITVGMLSLVTHSFQFPMYEKSILINL